MTVWVRAREVATRSVGVYPSDDIYMVKQRALAGRQAALLYFAAEPFVVSTEFVNQSKAR